MEAHQLLEPQTQAVAVAVVIVQVLLLVEKLAVRVLSSSVI
jgi:hypothetical protein